MVSHTPSFNQLGNLRKLFGLCALLMQVRAALGKHASRSECGGCGMVVTGTHPSFGAWEGPWERSEAVWGNLARLFFR